MIASQDDPGSDLKNLSLRLKAGENVFIAASDEEVEIINQGSEIQLAIYVPRLIDVVLENNNSVFVGGGDEIEVVVIDRSAKLMIRAPADVKILRGKVRERDEQNRRENGSEQ